MSISNLIQHSIDSPSLPYRLAPCAKAISVLLLVLSSPAAWAKTDNQNQQIQEQQPRPYDGSWYEMDLSKAPEEPFIREEHDRPQQQRLKSTEKNTNRLADIHDHDRQEVGYPSPPPSPYLHERFAQPDLSEAQDHVEHTETLRQALARVEEDKLVSGEQKREWTQRVQREREWAQKEKEKAQREREKAQEGAQKEARRPGWLWAGAQEGIDAPKEAEVGNVLYAAPESAAETVRSERDSLEHAQAQRLKSTEKNTKRFADMIKDVFDGKPSKDASMLLTALSNDLVLSTTNEKVDDKEDALLTGLNSLVTEITDVSNLAYPIVGNLFAAEPESTAEAAVEPKAAEKAPISSQKVAQPPAPRLAPPPKPAPIISHHPQAGSYIANQLATQQMFMTDDLQYRLGERLYTDPITGETDISSLWLNTTGSKNRFSSGHGQLHTKSSRYAVQLGGTLNKWSSGGNDQGLLGLTAGVGKATNHSHSTSSHHQANGSVDGYNLGLYSIWYADNHNKTGPYIDLLAQYSWFNNHIQAAKIATGANYRSYLFTTALETGYKVQLIETADTRFFIQPKAKVSWQRTSGLQHNESETQVRVDENSAVTTKLGMRTAWEFDIETLSSTRTLQVSPSFEANWIYNRMNPGVQLSNIYIIPEKLQNKTELASVHIAPQGTRNIADLKVGIEANINKNLLVWTHIGHQFGGHSYRDTQATLGANYRF